MGSIQINNINDLKKYVKIPKFQESSLNEVIKKYPVKLTYHLLKLIKKSPNLAKQFIPNSKELITTGIYRPWEGKANTGIYGLERMYKDRAIIMPIYQCPAYCRHCVRKDYLTRSNKAMSYSEINKALKYIKKDKRITEVLITGGDPLMDLKRLNYIIKGLRKNKNIDAIRIGTRSLMYDPKRINNSFIKMLLKYKKSDKPIEISTQFNHPDELTKESINVCKKLNSHGIRIYNQTTVLKGINDNPKTLMILFKKLRAIGVEMHYMLHCAQVKGAEHLQTSVKKLINIKRYFAEGNLSRRCNPNFILLTSVGKLQPLLECDIIKKKKNILYLKTPYTVKDFKSINPKFKLPMGCSIAKDKTIICEYIDGKD